MNKVPLLKLLFQTLIPQAQFRGEDLTIKCRSHFTWGWRQSLRVSVYHLLSWSIKIDLSFSGRLLWKHCIYIYTHTHTYIYICTHTHIYLVQISLWNVYSNHLPILTVGFLSFKLIYKCSLYFWTLVFGLLQVCK